MKRRKCNFYSIFILPFWHSGAYNNNNNTHHFPDRENADPADLRGTCVSSSSATLATTTHRRDKNRVARGAVTSRTASSVMKHPPTDYTTPNWQTLALFLQLSATVGAIGDNNNNLIGAQLTALSSWTGFRVEQSIRRQFCSTCMHAKTARLDSAMSARGIITSSRVSGTGCSNTATSKAWPSRKKGKPLKRGGRYIIQKTATHKNCRTKKEKLKIRRGKSLNYGGEDDDDVEECIWDAVPTGE